MITEDYVSFEVAKLLKEKGFYQDFLDEITPVWKLNGSRKELAFHGEDNYPCEWEEWYSAPTLQMVCKWLREVHNCIINVWYNGENWASEYYTNNTPTMVGNFVLISDGCSTYEEACEAAIKYVLENLI